MISVNIRHRYFVQCVTLTSLILFLAACLSRNGSSDLPGILRIDPGGTYHYRDPAVSPDGSMVVYTRYEPLGFDDEPDSGDIFVTNIEARETVRLTDNKVLDANPAWGPDGQRIVYLRQEATFDYQASQRIITDSLRILDVKDKADKLLYVCPAACGMPAWSPSGQQIAFHAGAWARQGSTENPTSDIYLIDINGEDLTRVTPDDSYALGPRWSSDGTAIVYRDSRDDNIRVVELSTGIEKRLNTNGLKGVSLRLAWYPDKKGILFSAIDPENGRRQIYSLRLHDNAIKPFFNQESPVPLDAQDPDILSNGSKLVFVENGSIYVIEQTGSNP